ncbi:hypothetical protein MpV1_238 [Micromonas sp. RCC1109 virus MpV1]|uniref:hypothetical protein n=1 Tax=Micromonas sp. RCC1109 virus MpV1 TaxID=880161 RepID=UPI0001EF4535|nr:hypothetical protein MpV1_238 [Micromonas sp. RCC1109 virus MpV1]ADQ91161.1 hypothetical protein MpV1_238 [Micromonas sp. RCC1109 virus MpV1]
MIHTYLVYRDLMRVHLSEISVTNSSSIERNISQIIHNYGRNMIHSSMSRSISRSYVCESSIDFRSLENVV